MGENKEEIKKKKEISEKKAQAFLKYVFSGSHKLMAIYKHKE